MLNTSHPEIEGAESADVVWFSAEPCWRPPEHLMTGKAAGIFHEYRNIELLPYLHLVSLQSMQMLYATNFNKLFVSYLGQKCAAKAVPCQERKGQVQELKRCKKVSKAFQIAKSPVKRNWIPAGWDGFQHVSVRLPGRGSQWPNEQIMKPSAPSMFYSTV